MIALLAAVATCLALAAMLAASFAVSCRSREARQAGAGLPEEQELRAKIAMLSRRAQVLSAEISLAKNPAPYLAVDIANRKIDLKVQGRSLRSFTISKIQRTGGSSFAVRTWVEIEARPLESPVRAKVVPGSGEAYSQAKIKTAVLGKVSKEQSARRFEYLFPQLTQRFREAFSQDKRFEVIPAEELDNAMAKAGNQEGKVNPDDPAQLRKIGKEAGADLIFVSYYYEMGGHGMPMHSNNVLTLVWVNKEETVKINRDYSRILSETELTSSDEMALKELMRKAESMF
jgi:hypothetical protein